MSGTAAKLNATGAFLDEIVEYLLSKEEKDFRRYTLIFANKRAGTYFMRALAERANRTLWAPRVISFEDFVLEKTHGTRSDKYDLIFRLYTSYQRIYGSQEGIDSFFYWGEMLLNDFDELDRYLVNAKLLFSHLKDIKEIEAIDYLTEEEMEIIERFWTLIDRSKDPERWSQFWADLYRVYTDYTTRLRNDHWGYYGMWLRKFAQDTEELLSEDSSQYVFAGFNALTKAEEVIIERMVERGAKVFWDYDDYYMSSDHEAGRFLRKHRKNTLFTKGFEFSNKHLADTGQTIEVISTVSQSSQTQFVSQSIQDLIASNEEWSPEKTAIVIPDENMMIPVLSALPDQVQAFNITMGYSLKNSNAYTLIESIRELIQTARLNDEQYTYRNAELLAVIRHPLLTPDPSLESHIIQKGLEEQQYYFSSSELKAFPDYQALLKSLESADQTIDSLIVIYTALSRYELATWDQVFVRRMIEMLQGVSTVIERFSLTLSNDALFRLLRQAASSHKVPFTGEPVSGLQIMGVLETRNIDFDRVFVLSMNEDFMPGGGSQQSFIPFSLRKGFGLPTINDNQSIQSYLFYRLLQRSKKTTLFYQSAASPMGGDVSRFIYQLKYNFPGQVIEKQEGQRSITVDHKPISFREGVNETHRLKRYVFPTEKFLSPSAIYQYLECKLKFYFRYTLGIYPNEDPEEKFDARVFGNILHHSMEELYKKGKDSYRKPEDITDPMIEEMVEKQMDLHAGRSNKRKGTWVGQYFLSGELVKKIIRELVKRDQREVDLEVVGLEKEWTTKIKLESGKEVQVGGSIDRLDRNNGILRVIDYKTGKDEASVKDWEDVFSGSGKAVFQTLFYSWLTEKHMGSDCSIQPLVFKTREIFDEAFTGEVKMDKEVIMDTRSLSAEFETRLKEILEEIFSDHVITQTDDLDACKYCDYSVICRRNDES